MPQIGWFEILIIILIAIIVIGPKEFPIVLRKLGQWIGSIKKLFSEVERNARELTELDTKEENKNKDNGKE
jgi:sec-independent protein translocase protein TatB